MRRPEANEIESANQISYSRVVNKEFALGFNTVNRPAGRPGARERLLVKRSGALFACWHGCGVESGLGPASGPGPRPLRVDNLDRVSLFGLETFAFAFGSTPSTHFLLLKGSRHPFGRRAPRALQTHIDVNQPWRNASRSALIVSACVVGIPCGKPL